MRESVRLLGQCFMIGFDGYEASSDVKRLIRDFQVGHIILFARNVDSPEQVADLVRELQTCAREAGHELPLLVAVDQEGGRVARLGPPWTVWPPLRALGRLAGDGDAEALARRMGEALAAEVSACGIKCDFVPIMDVDTNPRNPIINNRAFSDDPAVVSRLGVAMIRGLQGAGVAGCAKHFPGHGDTELDSHLDLPVVEHSRSRLDEVELPPFRKAIEAGVATIMMAHVLYPELDDERPASLSSAIVTALLRGEMKYDGVVIADDLEMQAVAAGWGPARSAVLALQAGCDVIPVCEHHDAQVRALEGAIRGVEAEEIPWTALEEADRRVRRLKERYLLPYDDPEPRRARQTAGRGEFVALAHELASRGGEPARFPWAPE